MLVVVALVVVFGAIGVADPHRWVQRDSPQYTVDPGTSPPVIWQRAGANTASDAVTITTRTYDSRAGRRLQRKWVHRFDPVAERYHGVLFFRGEDAAGSGDAAKTDTGVWSTSEVYLSETVRGELIGDVPVPDPDRTPANASTRVVAAYGALDDPGVTPRLDADEFRVLRSNASVVVVGVTEAGQYADLHGMDESRVANGTYRVVIDRESGNVRRTTDYRVLNRTDGTAARYRVTTYSYEDASVERPSWVTWSPVELLYDAVSV